ncbi:IclR family transcriptional regulator [Haloferax profundi]|uniref:IclR family transcriptional regulator n=1 Tax=Haloferax profundi TaxID=1544718 RepID=A0A0W1RFG9_9EURY|nr:IclR family transcriptional regulator [Haloferax profundi]KTG12209.1 hypothetical protein AUR66_19800 [Haloferax profundi]
MTHPNKTPSVKSTIKSLQIVEELQKRNGGTLKEISNALDISKSTIHRHLITLENAGYVTRDGNTFDVGYRFLNLGQYTRFRRPEFGEIKSALSDLVSATGHEVAFSVLDHGKIICLHQEHSQADYFDQRSTGNYFYAHNSAAGKAIIAEKPDREVQEIIDEHGLPQVTAKTITEENELFDQLETIREQGYALNRGESTEGLRSVAATVHSDAGQLLGSLSVSGPKYYIGDKEFHETIPMSILEIVSKLEQKFGEMDNRSGKSVN